MQPTQNQAESTLATRSARVDGAPGTDVDLIEVTPAVTLRGAGLYLVRHGWCQGDMYADPEAAFPAACALGAIRMAVFGTPAITVDPGGAYACASAVGVLADHLVRRLDVADPSDALTSRLGIGLEQIVADWNDDPARIASHVIAAMYAAADEWDRAHRRAELGEPVCCGMPMRLRTYPATPDSQPVTVYFWATCQEWASADDTTPCALATSDGAR